MPGNALFHQLKNALRLFRVQGVLPGARLRPPPCFVVELVVVAPMPGRRTARGR